MHKYISVANVTRAINFRFLFQLFFRISRILQTVPTIENNVMLLNGFQDKPS